jgi:hypothetical protein
MAYCIWKDHTGYAVPTEKQQESAARLHSAVAELRKTSRFAMAAMPQLAFRRIDIYIRQIANFLNRFILLRMLDSTKELILSL